MCETMCPILELPNMTCLSALLSFVYFVIICSQYFFKYTCFSSQYFGLNKVTSLVNKHIHIHKLYSDHGKQKKVSRLDYYDKLNYIYQKV